jgi:hypothetical protein
MEKSKRGIWPAHCNPDDALSDARQQIAPDSLVKLLKVLVLRKSSIENALIAHTLEDLPTADR